MALNDPSRLGVNAIELRRKFNELGYYSQVQKGILIERQGDYDKHLERREREKYNQGKSLQQPLPRCTRSQIRLYSTTDGVIVAVVHRMLKPDGSLGLSGLPDPKWLRVGEVIYVFDPNL